MELNICLSRWLSRRILKVTFEKIKLKFRELEKYKMENLGDKSHLIYNETCLNNDLLQVYTNKIYYYTKIMALLHGKSI